MEYIPASSLEVGSEPYEPQPLTVLQAAHQASVTQSAIIRWIRNGYLPATPSADGWQIPADKLAAAQAAAEDSRGTGPAPRQVGPRLVPAPEELRRSLAVQADERPARLDLLSETLVTPLVELIRDQTDVVQDQAEVIGWLQAERSRLNLQLAEFTESSETPQLEATDAEEHESETSDESNVDEVVSWLWNDAARPADTMRSISRALEPFTPASSGSADALVFKTRAAECDIPEARGKLGESLFAAGDSLGSAADHPWFVAPNSDAVESSGRPRSAGVPRLRPVVVRAEKSGSYAGPRDRNENLGQIIDETERKIAEMWRTEAELRSMRGTALWMDERDERAEQDEQSFWQRVWPLNRRSS